MEETRPREGSESSESPIACRLGALSEVERKREGELLGVHLAAFEERRERRDGFSYRYSADPALFAQIAELVSLEHRCCPFLDFQLEWRGGDELPWLHITGGARVKAFVDESFGAAPEANAK